MIRQIWRRTSGKHYITTEEAKAYGHNIPAGFDFQVSVPNWFQRKLDDPWWARALKWFLPDPHDPAWLWASLWHDWALKEGWSKLRASALMARAMTDSFKLRRWGWIPPTFAGTFVFTTLSPPLRRVFSWLKGTEE